MLYKGLCISFVLLAGAFLSSCYTTTKSTEGTSNTLGNTTGTSTDLTSSTSPGGDDDEPDDVEVKEFITSNFDRLRSDMAAGEGEYLSSLAVLMAIDDTEKSEFYAMTRTNFSQLFTSSSTTPHELFVRLELQVLELQGLEPQVLEQQVKVVQI